MTSFYHSLRHEEMIAVWSNDIITWLIGLFRLTWGRAVWVTTVNARGGHFVHGGQVEGARVRAEGGALLV